MNDQVSNLEPHQLRVVHELEEVKTKWIALNSFLHTETFKSLDVIEKCLLVRQSDIMEEYCSILGRRIQLFTSKLTG